MNNWKGSGLQVKKAINAGIFWFRNYEKEIDSLNVFPVPDGDTGRNMKSTLYSVRKSLRAENSPLASKMLSTAAVGALSGAKGCSGIIISLLFQGFSEGVGSRKTISPVDFLRGLRAASKKAWGGINNPVSGTILSVVDAVAASAEKHSRTSQSMNAAFEHILHDARQALEKTKTQLKVLRKANVVDAGGMGLVCFLEGMARYIAGKPLTGRPAKIKKTAAIRLAGFNSKTRYCLEFMPECGKAGEAGLKKSLKSRGDSLIVLRDGKGIYKVHVHTNDPDGILKSVQAGGRAFKVKVDDMLKQHRNFL